MGKQKAPNYGPLAEAERYKARLQYKAAQEGIAAWERQNAQVREDYRPWREIGRSSLLELNEGVQSGRFINEDWETPDADDLVLDPGYQFRLAEGEKAIRRRAAAGSGAYSGSTLKALQRYGQGLASQEYGAAYNRELIRYNQEQANRDREYNQLAGLAGTGYQSLGQTAENSRVAVGQQNTLRMQGAEALGSGAIGAANANINQQIAANQASQANFNNLLNIGTGVANAGIGWKHGFG